MEVIKEIIAEATHRAVCEFTESDGWGRCFDYALAGWFLATEHLRREYTLQAGALYIVADPPDGVVAMVPDNQGFARAEFHCWFATPGVGGAMGEFVDLSSRHYRNYVERGFQRLAGIEIEGRQIATAATERVRWTRRDSPPAFIWTTDGFPDVMWATPMQEATDFFAQAVDDRMDQYKPLIRLARMHYQRLAAKSDGTHRVVQASIGRNAPCPCGSGRKYKKCCLRKPGINKGDVPVRFGS